MKNTGIRSVVSGLARFLDVLPEPLVLRALEAPDTGRHRHA